MSPEDSYLVCKSRKNRPLIKVDVCTQCKKKVGCKDYVTWLEMHAVIAERTSEQKELDSIRETTIKRKKEKPKSKINVFEWKDE
jgi:hypothetical protein